MQTSCSAKKMKGGNVKSGNCTRSTSIASSKNCEETASGNCGSSKFAVESGDCSDSNSGNCYNSSSACINSKNALAACQTSCPEEVELEEEDVYTTPPVDIIENEKEYIIVADMPGLKLEDIDIKFNDGELSVFGPAGEDRDLEDVTFRCYQFDPGDYYREFRLGETINSDNITADYDNGVLTIYLPKREEVQPRKIAVKSN